MAEYIKLEDAITIIEEKQKELCPVGRYGRGYVYGSDREKYDAWDEIIDALENVPTADVAPVVHCKDCRSYNQPRIGWCEVHLDSENPDDFCSYGKYKTNGGADL